MQGQLEGDHGLGSILAHSLLLIPVFERNDMQGPACCCPSAVGGCLQLGLETCCQHVCNLQDSKLGWLSSAEAHEACIPNCQQCAGSVAQEALWPVPRPTACAATGDMTHLQLVLTGGSRLYTAGQP